MIYYIADTHFGHKGILNLDRRPFADVQQMEETLIMLWNATVKPGDTVYILGDFCWGKKDEWIRILRKLKGNKVLIQGNHDLKQYPPELRQHFTDIKDYKEISDPGKDGKPDRKVILSHYPIPFYKHSNDPNYFMLCGHVHKTAENKCMEKLIKELKEKPMEGLLGGTYQHHAQIYNVGCMMPWMEYTPRTLDEIIQRKEKYMQNETRLREIPKSKEEIRVSRKHVRNKKLADFLKENEFKKE